MTDPTPQPEIQPTEPMPTQPEIDPGGTPDEIPPQPGDNDSGFDQPPEI